MPTSPNNSYPMQALVFAVISVVMFLAPRICLMAKSQKQYTDPVRHWQTVNFFTWLSAIFGLAALIIFILSRAYNIPVK